MARRVKLNNDQQAYVVTELACYSTPSEVVTGLKERFGVEIARQSVEAYDPRKAAARSTTKWQKLFDRVRESYLRDLANIGIAHKAYRLRALQRIGEKAEARGDVETLMDALEQAAKEAGDWYTNGRSLEPAVRQAALNVVAVQINVAAR